MKNILFLHVLALKFSQCLHEVGIFSHLTSKEICSKVKTKCKLFEYEQWKYLEIQKPNPGFESNFMLSFIAGAIMYLKKTQHNNETLFFKIYFIIYLWDNKTYCFS